LSFIIIYCIAIKSKLTIPFLQAVEQSLKSVRLFDGGVADKRVAEYSGGMKRRLSVAISLIGDPKVLVLHHLTRIQEIECMSCTVTSSSIVFAHVKGYVLGASYRLFTWTNQVLDWIQHQEGHCGMLCCLPNRTRPSFSQVQYSTYSPFSS
jgi:hypothetical protein